VVSIIWGPGIFFLLFRPGEVTRGVIPLIVFFFLSTVIFHSVVRYFWRKFQWLVTMLWNCYLCYCPEKRKNKWIAGQTMWISQKNQQKFLTADLPWFRQEDILKKIKVFEGSVSKFSCSWKTIFWIESRAEELCVYCAKIQNRQINLADDSFDEFSQIKSDTFLLKPLKERMHISVHMKMRSNTIFSNDPNVYGRARILIKNSIKINRFI
jgi:hypothetical protein